MIIFVINFIALLVSVQNVSFAHSKALTLLNWIGTQKIKNRNLFLVVVLTHIQPRISSFVHFCDLADSKVFLT